MRCKKDPLVLSKGCFALRSIPNGLFDNQHLRIFLLSLLRIGSHLTTFLLIEGSLDQFVQMVADAEIAA